MTTAVEMTLGGVCESIDYGVTTSANFTNVLGPKFLRITDLTEGGVDWARVPHCVIDPTEERNALLRNGDIVVARTGGTVGKSFLVQAPPRAVSASYLLRLRPQLSLVAPEYLSLFLGSDTYWSQLMDAARGAAQPNVNATTLSAIRIPVPNIDKQRRIASRLKAQLTAVGDARQAARAQLNDAQRLIQAILEATFSNVDDWPVVPLREAGQIAAGITLGRKTKETVLTPIPYLRVANVQDGHLNLTDMKTVEATQAEIKKCQLRRGDLLLTEGGDLDKLGRGACWDEQLPVCIHQNHIFRVRFPADRFVPEFVAMQIGSAYGKAYFFAHAKKTTGIASINQQVLGSFPLLAPRLTVQKRIVAIVSKQLVVAEELLRAASQQIADIDRLPTCLLAQFFENINHG